MNGKYSKVLIHGNFEVLHTGHLRLFNFAKDIGEELVVGLNAEGLHEEEVRRRIGELRAISLIDEVSVFSELFEFISQIKPSVIVKGREFANQNNIEEKLIQSMGGELIFSPGRDFINNIHSTDLHISESTKNRIKVFLERNQISLKDCLDVIENFKTKKVLVVGDIILDEYIECKNSGFSLESYVPVARPLSNTRYLGGAGIVAAHCSTLGAETKLLTTLSDDKESGEIKEFCVKFGIQLHSVINRSHPTVLKQRFIQGGQTLFRLNRFIEESFERDVRAQLFDEFCHALPNFDLVLFCDFSYGVLDSSDSPSWVMKAIESGAYVAADSQTSSKMGNLSKFVGAHLICPTEQEARLEVRDQEGLIGLSQRLLNQMQANLIFLKLGADGILINGEGLRTDHLPALNESPIDVSGAGDALLASATLALSSKSSPYMAAFLGGLASAVQITRRGNQPINNSEIQSALAKFF